MVNIGGEANPGSSEQKTELALLQSAKQWDRGVMWETRIAARFDTPGCYTARLAATTIGERRVPIRIVP